MGEIVVHNGATWQAKCDTGQTPGGSDYVCVARAGADGKDGKSVVWRGEYDPGDAYARLDVVTKAGSCWLAVGDGPGVL
ncbi:MAG TPA: collagen-like protein, partial [Roseiarcus sp.]